MAVPSPSAAAPPALVPHPSSSSLSPRLTQAQLSQCQDTMRPFYSNHLFSHLLMLLKAAGIMNFPLPCLASQYSFNLEPLARQAPNTKSYPIIPSYTVPLLYDKLFRSD